MLFRPIRNGLKIKCTVRLLPKNLFELSELFLAAWRYYVVFSYRFIISLDFLVHFSSRKKNNNSLYAHRKVELDYVLKCLFISLKPLGSFFFQTMKKKAKNLVKIRIVLRNINFTTSGYFYLPLVDKRHYLASFIRS
mgnify:CR=1 FL=1